MTYFGLFGAPGAGQHPIPKHLRCLADVGVWGGGPFSTLILAVAAA